MPDLVDFVYSAPTQLSGLFTPLIGQEETMLAMMEECGISNFRLWCRVGWIGRGPDGIVGAWCSRSLDSDLARDSGTRPELAIDPVPDPECPVTP